MPPWGQERGKKVKTFKNENIKKKKKKKWIDVDVPSNNPHCLVVNAGDLIQQWTNDHWISNVHRVVKKKENVSSSSSAADDNDAEHRSSSNGSSSSSNNNKSEDDDEQKKTLPVSIVFFTGPHNDTVIEMLPSPLLDGQDRKYEPVTSGDHLFRKLNASSK